jgi:hypothetical protein
MMAPTVESNPLTFAGFRLVTSVNLTSKVHSSRDCISLKVVGASQSAARLESVLDFWGVTVGRAGIPAPSTKEQFLKSAAQK